MNVFRRKELKFLIDEEQRRMIEEVLRQRMIPDRYGKSTICNLYYDTADFRLIRRSLEKPVYKEKLRLRSYGVASPDTDMFLELKKKYKGVVYKRRISMTEADAYAFIVQGKPPDEESQIAREMLYFRNYYPTLEPRVYLCYEREAWYDPEDNGFRMTLDRNIRYRMDDLSLSSPVGGRELLLPEQSLLEVKAEGAIPMWLTELLSRHRIWKQSFSKYGRAYEEMLREKLQEERGYRYV